MSIGTISFWKMFLWYSCGNNRVRSFSKYFNLLLGLPFLDFVKTSNDPPESYTISHARIPTSYKKYQYLLRACRTRRSATTCRAGSRTVTLAGSVGMRKDSRADKHIGVTPSADNKYTSFPWLRYVDTFVYQQPKRTCVRCSESYLTNHFCFISRTDKLVSSWQLTF